MKHPLQILYDNEVNFLIECFYDLGFTFFIGDEQNGFKAHFYTYSFQEGQDWLVSTAKTLYNLEVGDKKTQVRDINFNSK